MTVAITEYFTCTLVKALLLLWPRNLSFHATVLNTSTQRIWNVHCTKLLDLPWPHCSLWLVARSRKVKGATRFQYDRTLQRVEFEPNRSDIHLYDTPAHPALPLNSFPRLLHYLRIYLFHRWMQGIYALENSSSLGWEVLQEKIVCWTVSCKGVVLVKSIFYIHLLE